MNVLETLRRKNPQLPLYSVEDKEFAPYGQVLKIKERELEELAAALEASAMPEQGNSYEASFPPLEASAAIRRFTRTVFGAVETQAGFCNGHGRTLNAFEYHKCSELNFSTTGLVLLLARCEDMDEGMVNSDKTLGFYLPPNVPVEIYPRVLHFAPCRIEADGFKCLVQLEKGVNSPLDAVDTSADGEEKLLWMKGKWLTCHKDSPQAKKGAFQGITGKNISLEV